MATEPLVTPSLEPALTQIVEVGDMENDPTTGATVRTDVGGGGASGDDDFHGFEGLEESLVLGAQLSDERALFAQGAFNVLRVGQFVAVLGGAAGRELEFRERSGRGDDEGAGESGEVAQVRPGDALREDCEEGEQDHAPPHEEAACRLGLSGALHHGSCCPSGLWSPAGSEGAANLRGGGGAENSETHAQHIAQHSPFHVVLERVLFHSSMCSR